VIARAHRSAPTTKLPTSLEKPIFLDEQL
jgi:hypothetical protein